MSTEFEDVFLATEAMHHLFGNTLGGLVTDGIRLSYAENTKIRNVGWAQIWVGNGRNIQSNRMYDMFACA
jgi:hypothetical protein